MFYFAFKVKTLKNVKLFSFHLIFDYGKKR